MLSQRRAAVAAPECIQKLDYISISGLVVKFVVAIDTLVEPGVRFPPNAFLFALERLGLKGGCGACSLAAPHSSHSFCHKDKTLLMIRNRLIPLTCRLTPWLLVGGQISKSRASLGFRFGNVKLAMYMRQTQPNYNKTVVSRVQEPFTSHANIFESLLRPGLMVIL